MLRELGRHAEAVVLDADGVVREFAFPLQLGDVDVYLPAVGGVLDGVGEEIEQYLVQAQLVAENVLVVDALGVDVELMPLGHDLADDDGAQVVQKLRNARRGRMDFDLAALDAAHFKHVVEQRQQMVARELDFTQVVVEGNGVVLGQGEVGEADDGVHGRADVVRHLGEELALGTADVDGLVLVELSLAPAVVHVRIHGEHHEYAEHDKHDLEDGVLDEPAAEAAHVIGDEVVFLLDQVGLRQPGVVLDDHEFVVEFPHLVQRLGRGFVGGLAHPHEGGGEDHEEHDDPDEGGVAEALRRVVPEDDEVDEEAEDAPEGEDAVGFGRKRRDGPDRRQEGAHAEGEREEEAEGADNGLERPSFPVRVDEGAGGDVGVGYGGAHARDVDYPDDGRASGQGDDHG